MFKEDKIDFELYILPLILIAPICYLIRKLREKGRRNESNFRRKSLYL